MLFYYEHANVLIGTCFDQTILNTKLLILYKSTNVIRCDIDMKNIFFSN